MKWIFIAVIWYGADVAPNGVVIDSPDESSCRAKRTYYTEMLDAQVRKDEMMGYVLTECELRGEPDVRETD